MIYIFKKSLIIHIRQRGMFLWPASLADPCHVLYCRPRGCLLYIVEC